MNRFSKLFGIIALIAVMTSLTGCMTMSSIGGTVDAHGLISQARVVQQGATEIASYTIVFGLLDSGYDYYATKVKEALAEGLQVVSLTTSFFGFYTIVTAYAQQLVRLY